MATIRSYTTIEQSRKLAEILPLESADMYWWSTSLRYYIEAMDDGDFNEEEGHIRAWSLAALLDILPVGTESHKQSDCSISYYYVEVYNNKKYFSTKRYDNLVDACYEMIEKLHKLKYYNYE